MTLQRSPFASVSEPDDLLWRREYLLAVALVTPCWLRVILRPEVKTEAATDAAAESGTSSGATAEGELLWAGVQLSMVDTGRGGRGGRGVCYDFKSSAVPSVSPQRNSVSLCPGGFPLTQYKGG